MKCSKCSCWQLALARGGNGCPEGKRIILRGKWQLWGRTSCYEGQVATLREK